MKIRNCIDLKEHDNTTVKWYWNVMLRKTRLEWSRINMNNDYYFEKYVRQPLKNFITASSSALEVPMNMTSGTGMAFETDEEFDEVLNLSQNIFRKPCRYCHGKTLDDRYGHCEACGAPRK